jgi:LPXTG-motif cell wall-anchored protein
MFPSPLDIPPSVDCVALAETGINTVVPLALGLLVLALGIAFFIVARGRARGAGVALGLVLVLGSASLAIGAPATSASADACTPLDYQLDAELESPAVIESGGAVIVEFWITDVVDNDGTPPITVTIPQESAFGSPSLLNYDGWTADYSNPDFWSFTYDGPLPKGTMSSVLGFTFTISNGNSSTAHYDIPISIVTGSGGDTVESNNTATVSVDVNGIVP